MNENDLLKGLTEEQRAAVINISPKVSVTANAGSGKTTMMVTKYLYLLLFHSDKFNYKNIVAITFTKKAASEILAKIRKEIDKLLQGDYDLTDEQTSILKETNRHLMSLSVGTIHSFCRRIVRDYGYKIGLQSNLKIIDEIEKEIVLEKLIHNVLSSEAANNPLTPDIKNAIFYLGFSDAVTVIRKMLGKKNYFDKQKENYNKTLDKVFISLKQSMLLDLDSIINNYFKNNHKIDIPEKYHSRIESLEGTLNSLSTLLKTNPPDLEEISKKMDEARKYKYGNSIIMKKSIGENNDKLWKNMTSKVLEYNDFDFVFENRYNLIKSLIAIEEKVSEDYNNYSIENNVMDNDDTINYAVDLLKHDTVRRLLRFDVKYLMIDEFQDTDERQLEIANSLSEDGSTLLFVVGDDKQSIYSFRDADVRVFKEFRGSITEQCGNKNNLELNVSFRATHHLNCFVNKFFKPFMSADNSDYDVDYQKITTASYLGKIEADCKDVDVYFHYKAKLGDKSKETMALKAIHKLLEKGVAHKDICVLSRRSEHLLNLSNLLKEHGVYSYVTSSSGFFDRNEIKDLIAYLQFIDNPDNDLLLAATLKSSLFNYSDRMMMQQLKKEKGKTLWQSIIHQKKKGNDIIDDETYDVLCKSIELSNKLPITNLVMKIVDESNWNYYYNTSETERDAVFRNLYKFMDFIREVERRDYTTLADLFLYLDKIFASGRMSEEYGNTTDSIKMSTIHSAKGLEYKHLILLDYELQPVKRSRGNDSPTIDEEYGPKLKVPKSIDSFDNFGKANTFIDDYIDSVDKMKQEAENIRLSYVAMTRAKSSITLIPPLEKVNQQDMWDSIFPGMGEILEGQKKTLGNKDRTELHKEVISKEVNDKVDCYDTVCGKISEIDCDYKVNFDFSEYNIAEFDFSNYSNLSDHKSKYTYTENFEQIPAREQYIQFNATKLNKFDQSKQTKSHVFKEIYIYGLPNIAERLKSVSAENKQLSALSGVKFGSLFHNAMERVDSFTDSELNLDGGKLHGIINELYINETEGIKEEAFGIISQTLTNLLTNDFIKQNKDVLLNSRKEFDLKSIFGTQILQGEIDLLHIDGNSATIWDWKTNQISSNKGLDSVAKSYDLQMKIYALLAFKYAPEIEEVSTNLLFVRNISDNNDDWIVSKTYMRDDENNITIEIAKMIGEIDSTYGYIYPLDLEGIS